MHRKVLQKIKKDVGMVRQLGIGTDTNIEILIEAKLVQVVKLVIKDQNELEAELGSIGTMTKEMNTKLETAIEMKLVQSVEKKVIGQVNIQIKTMKEDISEALEKRQNNLIVHEVKDSQEDDDAVLMTNLLKVGLQLDGSKHVEKVS